MSDTLVSALGYEDLPLITERAAKKAPDGLYRIKNRYRVADFYRVELDRFDRDVRQIMIARVDDGKRLPVAVHHAEIRPDGKRLIVAWVPATETA